MRSPRRLSAWLTAWTALTLAPSATAQVEATVAERPVRLELEGGAFWFSRNDVRIPGDTGTRFDLTDLTGGGASPLVRLTLDWDVNERHGLRFLYAPVRAEGHGTLSEPIEFDGRTFDAGRAKGQYRFDTYRVTWRYRFWRSERAAWRVGLTGLVRDAAITVSQDGDRARKSNTGLVPLLHLDGEWRFARRWRLLVDLDGAAASQGRAFDLALKAGYDLDERWRLAFGYRTIEGGVDNDEVFNFAWLHAAVVSLTYGF